MPAMQTFYACIADMVNVVVDEPELNEAAHYVA